MHAIYERIIVARPEHRGCPADRGGLSARSGAGAAGKAIEQTFGSRPTGVRRAGVSAGVWDLARADGVVTESERRDLEILTELLGVSLDDSPAIPQRSLAKRQDFEGRSVCFTGVSVCTIHGAFLSREEQEALAEQAGMVVKAGVSAKLDLLVLADTDSKSGKALRVSEAQVCSPWDLERVSVGAAPDRHVNGGAGWPLSSSRHMPDVACAHG